MHLRALKNKNLWFSTASACLAVTYIFFAWAARNEIFYLCGNFKEGVSYANVVRQMETSNLSVLATETSDFTPYISQASPLHLYILECRVEFDTPGERVVHSTYGWKF